MVRPLALVLLLVSGQAWRASTAPGPASRAHESVAGNCDACHMPFKGLPNEKCLTCHTGLKKFHAAVATQKCVACHTEHKGPTADQTRATARVAATWWRRWPAPLSPSAPTASLSRCTAIRTTR